MNRQVSHQQIAEQRCVELERNRLLDVCVPRLHSGMVLTLTGGPGTGKTVLLRQIQRRMDIGTAYVDLTRFSADSAIFIRQLEFVFAQLWATVFSDWRGSSKSRDEDGKSPLKQVEALLDELLLSGDTPAMIILDGCEVLESRPLWLDIISLFLHRLPSFVSLVLSSRVVLSFPDIPSLRLQGKLLEWGSEELHFDQEEIFVFFKQSISGITSADAALVQEKAGGWPAGIALLCLEMCKRGIHILDTASSACLHEYMECAVFAGLRPDTRRLLCCLALVQPFDDRLLDTVFADEKDELRDILSSFSFFFEPRTDNSAAEGRQFAHLYADFFEKQALSVLGRKGIRAIHEQAARFFHDCGQNDRSLAHLISLEEWHEAIALLQSCANQWFEGEDYSLLPYWVEQLPKDILVDYPQLAVSLGQAHLYLGDVDKAGQAYALAHQQSRIGSKIWLESGCLLCEVLLLQGNKEECVELASELVDHAGLISPFRVRALMFQAIGLHLLCRFEECERIWKKIETIARSRFIPLTRTARCYLMGPKAVFHNLERGEFEESGQILDEAITVFRSSDPMKRLGWMLLFKGILKLEMHCYPEALAWFREAEAVSGRTNRSVHAASIAFLAFGLVMMGQKDEAKHWLDRAAPLASRDLSLWAPIICSLARAQLKEEGEDVVAELQLAWNLACQRQMILPMTMTAYIAFAMHESGGDDLAIQFCRQAANRCRQWNVIHREAQLLLYLYILEQERNPLQARQDFKRAMVLISEHNLGFLLIRDKRMDGLSLTLLAIKLNIETSFFLKLSSSWGKKAFEGLIPIFQQATLDVKTRIASIWARHGYQPALEYIELAMRVVRGKKTIARLDSMKQRLQACPPEPLHVNLFGPFTLVRGEEEIPEQAWKRHKARDLFKFLCLHPDRVFTREQLTEIFWPDSSPEKAKANLWSAVSTIRAAIEPELSARAKSSYLHCTSQTYSLRLPDDSTIDTVVFENRVKDGLHYLNSGDTARALLCFESAVSLYPDELLPEDRYAPWSTEIREHYERLFTSTLRKMADLYLEKRDFEATIKIYRQIIALDSWDEDSYLELMRCYVLQGQDLKAVEVYRLCEEVLSRELGVTPAPRLRDFLDRILQRRESGFKSAVGLGGVPN